MKRLFFRTPGTRDFRMDSNESAWLNRELEFIDTETYSQLYAALRARDFIPDKAGIPPWAMNHTWREMDMVGKAKIITAMGDDLPRTDVFKKEVTKTIKTVGGAYGYSWDEMLAASSNGMKLDLDRAIAKRFAIEEEVDSILAYGRSGIGIDGLLTLPGVTTFTLGTKAKGGVAWGTLVAPNATGREVAYDLIGFAVDVVTKSLNRIVSVDILLPIDDYAYAASKEMSATDNTKALDAALASPFINSIQPWTRCSAANSGGLLTNDTMVAYAKDPMYLAGINPMPYTAQAPQQNNLEWKINALAKTGGTVVRYTYLVRYATGMS